MTAGMGPILKKGHTYSGVCGGADVFAHALLECVCVCVLSFLHAVYFCSADSLTTVSLLYGARTVPPGAPLELVLLT